MEVQSGPYVLPDEHLIWMGRVADAWANLEFAVDQGIWHLTDGYQQLIACVTAQLISIHPRMKAFIALVEVRNGKPETVAALKKLYSGTLSGLSDRRNRTIHDPRHINKRTGEVNRLEITAKPKVHFGFIPEAVGDLKRFHAEIGDAIMLVKQLRDQAIAEIEALPEESLPTLSEIVRVPTAPADHTTEG